MHKGILAARTQQAQERVAVAVGDLERVFGLTPPANEAVPARDPTVRRLFDLEYLADRLEEVATLARQPRGLAPEFINEILATPGLSKTSRKALAASLGVAEVE